MALNPSIILAGQQPDILGAMQRGNALAGQVNEQRRQNALAQVYQEHGQGIAQGEQSALNALAAHDPMSAYNIRIGMDDRDYRRQRDATTDARAERQDARAEQQWQHQLAQHAATLSEQERKTQSDQITRVLAGAKHFYDQNNPQGYGAFLQQNSLDPAEYPFEQFPALAAQYGEAAKILSGGGGDTRVQSSDILDDGTVVTVMSDGTPRVVSPTGEVLSGQAAADAVRAARDYGVENQRAINHGRQSGRLTADVELGGEAQGVKDLASATVKAGMDAWESYGKIQTNLSNLDEAISALDNGAQSGMVYNMLPNVTEASASLQNAMDRMGLDIIGMVTFGALSEGEMRLAMETAVPRNLAPAELRDWLTRKRDAQAKAAEALADAAQYMTTPGNTINGWIARNRATGRQSQQPAQPSQQATTPSGGLQVGHTEGGYRYIGGDPSNSASWERAQ